jgi:hypothetical protein
MLFCHMLAHLPRLHEVYNAALAAFRARHAIRNHAQPMPNLQSMGTWLEAPFWTWSARLPQRRRLFARGSDRGVELSDQGGWSTVLPLSAERDAWEAVDQLEALERSGVKIRSRALLTTLVARLLGSDLFVHGIGGARYDEVTDELIREFFACRAPHFIAVSGTLHLPIETASASRRGVGDWQRRLRELTYHPDVAIGEISRLSSAERMLADALVREKRKWINTEQSPQTARARHLGIEQANSQLRSIVRPLAMEARAGLAEALRAQRAGRILKSREYAFCLFPADTLRSLLSSLALAIR